MPNDFAYSDRTFSATGSATITPSDTDGKVAPVSAAIQVDVAGAVRMTFADGTIDTLTLAASTPYPYQVIKVWATGTAATGIHALRN